MTEPQFTASDTDFAAALRISLDCPQCTASKDLQRFYATQHERLVHTINVQTSRLIAAQEAKEDAAERHCKQVKFWRLVAFAGWFTVAIGLITGWWR